MARVEVGGRRIVTRPLLGEPVDEEEEEEVEEVVTDGA